MGLRRLVGIVAVVASSSVMLAAPAAAAPPGNDEIVSATNVTRLPFTDAQSTVEATPSPSDPWCSGVGPTVWYAVTVPRNTTVTVSTAGSDYDTTLSAYTGSPGDLTQIACNDDFGSLQSQIELTVPRRQTVYVMVGSYAGTPGGSLAISMQDGSAPARPARPAGLNRLVSGPLTGTASYEFAAEGCAIAYHEVDATYETERGTGTVHIEGCSVSVDGSLHWSGTFTIETPTGGTITGTAEGPMYPFALTLTVTGSSGEGLPRNLAGTIEFVGNDFIGPVTGSLSGALKPAAAPAPA